MINSLLYPAMAVCMFSFLGYSGYLFGIYVRFLFRKEKDLPYNHEPLSIIIAARNEADNLQKFLPAVLQQERDRFEVIVVNDGSVDSTREVLNRFVEDFPSLRVIHSDKPLGKKRALTAGIREARYDLLLFTDADCVPASRRWAAGMASHFTDGIEIVLGYGAYKTAPGLLNRIVQTDTALIAARYAGFTLWKKPLMGVGRNLAYRKSLWEKHSGFSADEDIPYGDDDLFIMRAANADNTALCFHPAAYTYSVPPQTWRAWFNQKIRHLKAGVRYPKSNLFLLSAEPVFEGLFWLSGLMMLPAGGGIWFLFFLSFYWVYKTLILRNIYNTLNIKTGKLFITPVSIILLFALFFIGINATFAKSVSWKEK